MVQWTGSVGFEVTKSVASTHLKQGRIVGTLRAEVVHFAAVRVLLLQEPDDILALVAVDRFHVVRRIAHRDDPVANVCQAREKKKGK